MAKPLLRWAGSKRQLVPQLAAYWGTQHTRYVEPFAGSACLFFNLQPQAGLLGDINADLIEMYGVVRDSPAALSEALQEHKNDPDEYYELRATDPTTLSETDRAARFIYLNRFCFNGLYRTNQRGQFNVPYGGRKSGTVPSEADLLTASRLLTQSEIVAGDFSVVLQRVRPGDFVYLDPPFSVAGRRVFKEYDPASFSDSELVRLRAALKQLDKSGVTFLLSYADCPEGEELGAGFRLTRVSTRRNIAGFSGNRRSADELLVTNLPSVA